MPSKPRGNASKPSTSKKNAEPPKVLKSSNTNAETTSGLTQEAEDKFELELCWCIQQLELCLSTGKLAEKQAQDLSKNINILKSNKAPLIKKRQVMRSTLGNYREKMTQDEQKLGKVASSMKFLPPHSEKKKCIFVKKAACKSTIEKQNLNSSEDITSTSINRNAINTDVAQNVFKFNFQIAE